MGLLRSSPSRGAPRSTARGSQLDDLVGLGHVGFDSVFAGGRRETLDDLIDQLPFGRVTEKALNTCEKCLPVALGQTRRSVHTFRCPSRRPPKLRWYGPPACRARSVSPATRSSSVRSTNGSPRFRRTRTTVSTSSASARTRAARSGC